MLQRERKRRQEAIEAFGRRARGSGRSRRGRAEVLEEYMPEPLSDDDLERIVDDAIAEVGATSCVISDVSWPTSCPRSRVGPTDRWSASWSARSSPNSNAARTASWGQDFPTSSRLDRMEEERAHGRPDGTGSMSAALRRPAFAEGRCRTSSPSPTTLLPSWQESATASGRAARALALHDPVRRNRLTIEGGAGTLWRRVRCRRVRRVGQGGHEIGPGRSMPCSARSIRPRACRRSLRTSYDGTVARRSHPRRSCRSTMSTPSGSTR